MASGTVLPNGSLVLKLYYTRNTYTVDYKYESDVTGAPALPGTATYRFGQNVTVAADAVMEHYDFHGWYTKSSAFAVNAGMAFFTMPGADIVIYGTTARTPIPDGTMKIHKVVKAPSDFTGDREYTFRPNQPITRAELVKIAMSFYGTVHSDSDVFNDVGEHWAAAFINGAADLGFVNGYSDETFQPDRYVTRAEAIKIINRTLNRAPDKDHLLSDMITWVDNMNVDAWYYAEIQEAANSHTYTWDKTGEIWEKIRPVRNWSELEKSWSEANDGE